MKIFKSTDEKLKRIGFEKVREDKYGVTYERYDETYKYTQILGIYHKASGRHIVTSYDQDLFDETGIGNTAVALTYYEAKLALKKMKEMGLHKGARA